MRSILFLSNSLLIHGLLIGEIVQADLDKGLFFLTSDWKQTLEHKNLDNSQGTVGAWIREVLQKTMDRAKKEKRLVQATEPSSSHAPDLRYEQLNQFLATRGIVPLDFTRYGQSYYNYPTVVKAAEEQGFVLEVYA